MKFDKKRFNELLSCWIKWDKKLWGEFREVQLKLLYDRLVLEMTYPELAKYHQLTPVKIREILQSLFTRIEKSHGKDLSQLLREINRGIEAREKGVKDKPDQTFNFETIFLN